MSFNTYIILKMHEVTKCKWGHCFNSLLQISPKHTTLTNPQKRLQRRNDRVVHGVKEGGVQLFFFSLLTKQIQIVLGIILKVSNVSFKARLNCHIRLRGVPSSLNSQNISVESAHSCTSFELSLDNS